MAHAVTGDTPIPSHDRAGRRRPRLIHARPRAVLVRLTDQEYAELATAADQTGLTPTGYCAQAAIDTARNLHTDTPERAHRQALADLQAELLHIRVALNQIGTELRHTSSTPPDDLARTIASTNCSLTRLDAVITSIHHQLAQHRPPIA
jgi:hypothetical protein